MLGRVFRFGLRTVYKRNQSQVICRSFYTYSTNQNKIKNMEQKVDELTKKVEEIKLQTPEEVEAKPEQKVQLSAQAKEQLKAARKEKKKKEKEDKPKVEKKEEEKLQVGPKMFSMIDIRVSEIVDCWKHPQSENLYCEKILVCGQVRQIASGLQKFVPLEQMKGKVIVMANLKPRPLAGFLSNGMVVCASTLDHTAVELLIPDGQLGERLYLQGFEDLFTQGDLQPVLNPKKKILQKCSDLFKTNEQGFVTWNGINVRTKAGPVKALTIKNGNVS